MILIILDTVIAYALFIHYEQKKVALHRGVTTGGNSSFGLGIVVLVMCWLTAGARFWNSGELAGMSEKTRVIAGVIAVAVALALYVYILWFALPKGTYGSEVQSGLMSTGIYGICRHPGFYGFTLTALAVALLVGSGKMLILMLIHSALNLGYICLQDAIYFPAYLEGYDDYKKQVRFL